MSVGLAFAISLYGYLFQLDRKGGGGLYGRVRSRLFQCGGKGRGCVDIP
jgi:hypothetical protein